MTSNLDAEWSGLYSDDLRVREQAAKQYRIFPQQRLSIPSEYRRDWMELLGERRIGDGEPWPDDIAGMARQSRWPDHAFGTANAACLLIWHRPGDAGPGGHPPAGAHIGPKVPVLGGIPHAQNLFWGRYHPSPSWNELHEYLPRAFAGLENPWNQVMIACLNPEPGKTGQVDRTANLAAVRQGGRIDHLVSVCRPKVIVSCGEHVQRAMQNWKRPDGISILEVSHPINWGSFGGRHHGPDVVRRLRAAL